MDIKTIVDLSQQYGTFIFVIAFTTTILEVSINLIVNKVFLEPFITKWGSKYSRKVVPYLISKLEPFVPELLEEWKPSDIEKLLFDEIINAPGSPVWYKAKKETLNKKEKEEIRKIYNDLIKEFDFVKASNRCVPKKPN